MLLTDPLTIVSLVIKQFLHIQMNNISADVVQEGLVVGDDQQSFLPVLQVIVQPDDSI